MKMRQSIAICVGFYILVFAAVWSSVLIHRRGFDRAFFAWYRNRTPENEAALRVESRKNDVIRLEDSAITATVVVLVGYGVYRIALLVRRKPRGRDVDRAA